MSLRTASEQAAYEDELAERAEAFERFKRRAARVAGDPLRAAFNAGWDARARPVWRRG